MSKYQGGMIGSVNSTSGTDYTGKANGIFPLPQQIVNKQLSLWARGQTRPNPPTIGTATGTGTTTISVAFIPPVQNGGSAITSYTVTSSGGQTATGASSPIVVSGLTTGTSYTFTVTATNALGTSDSSGTSNSTQDAITDPYFSSVALLLTGDSFTDSSNNHYGVTNYGNTTLNSTIKKYNTSSYNFNGVDQHLTIPNIGALGSANFTIECWAYRTGLGTGDRFLLDSGNGNNWLFRWASGSFIQFHLADASQSNVILTSSYSFPLTTWIHFAVVRFGNVFTIYINGTSLVSATNAINAPNTLAGGGYIVGIGGQGTTNLKSDLFQGNIADVRITKGVARYTSNFTSPTAALPTL